MPVEMYGPLEQVWLEIIERFLIVLTFSSISVLVFCALLYSVDSAYKRRVARSMQSRDHRRLQEITVIEAQSFSDDYYAARFARTKPIAYDETPFVIPGNSISRGDRISSEHVNRGSH
jgi:hypothetical protein